MYAEDYPAKYLFDKPTHAEAELPAMKAGKYDLVLYDETNEIARLPKVITVLATPPPVISSVSPSNLEYTKQPQRVTLKGERFSAGLKATVGNAEMPVRVESPERAEITVPAMPSGTFDLVLSDPVQELVRVQGAVTVAKPIITSLTPHVVEVSKDGQNVVIVGKHLQPTIRMFVAAKEVSPQFLSLEKGEFQLPSLPVGSYDVAIFDPAGNVELAHYKDMITVKPVELVEVTMQVRFVVRPEVLAVVKQSQTATSGALTPTSGPVLVSFQQDGGELLGNTKVDLKEGPVVIVNGVVRLLASKKAAGLQFETQALKAGAAFVLNTATYVLNGEILGFTTVPARGK